jgi:hypothetical protein
LRQAVVVPMPIGTVFTLALPKLRTSQPQTVPATYG